MIILSNFIIVLNYYYYYSHARLAFIRNGLLYMFVVLRYIQITLDCRVLFKTQRIWTARTIEDTSGVFWA